MGRAKNLQKEIKRQRQKDRIREASAAGITVIPERPHQSDGRGGPQRLLRVAAYCRVSTDEEEQASSIQLQKTTYEDKITHHEGWELAGIYADEGISGTSVNYREDLQRLIEDCKAGKIDMVLVKSISRLARNVVDCLNIIETLRDLPNPVAIVFETDNINTLDASGRMLITVLSMVAEEESHSKSQIMNWSVENRFSKGLFLIPALFGYDKDPDTGNLVINSDEAKVVKLCYYLYLSGFSFQFIARTLTALEIPTFTGKSVWHPSSIRGMLQNERHYGAVLAHKTFTPNFLNHKAKKNNGDRKQYLREDDHDPIVTKRIYEAANRKMLMERAGRDGSPMPSMDVVDAGILKGFVSVNRKWQGFTDQDFIEATKSVSSEETAAPTERTTGSFCVGDYEVVSGRLFSSSGRPVMTVKDGTVSFNTACMKKFQDAEYVEILLNSVEKKIAVRPCSEESPYAFRWGRLKDAKWLVSRKKCMGLIEPLFGLMGWESGSKYRLIGEYLEDGDAQMLLFDLLDPEVVSSEKDNSTQAEEAEVSFHFGSSALFGAMLFETEPYAGGWEIMRPARFYRYCAEITREELDQIREEAQELLTELKGA